MTKNKSFQDYSQASSSIKNKNDVNHSNQGGDDDGDGSNDKEERYIERKSIEPRLNNLKKKFQASVFIMIQKAINLSTRVIDKALIDECGKIKINDAINQFTIKWFEKIVSLHSEEDRKYHTLCHLEEMFGFVDLIIHNDDGFKSEKETMNWDTYDTIITLSIFFHDAIYNPKSNTNEEDSIILYQQFENELFQLLSAKDTERQENENRSSRWIGSDRVCTYIQATKSHNLDGIVNDSSSSCIGKDDTSIKCIKIFLDADMAVLGKYPTAYDHYASLIRKEYIHVPHELYCEKRAEILQSFVSNVTNTEKEGKVEKRFIFASDIMRETFEEKAIDNLQREIGMLRQGIIPGFETDDITSSKDLITKE